MTADALPPDRAVEPPTPGWSLEHAGDGSIDLITAHGHRHRDVEIRRAFPVTAPRGPIAILAADGTEVAWLDALTDAPPPLQAMVVALLAAREDVPAITTIEHIGESRPAEWQVISDRGPLRFRVAHTDDVFRRGDGSICVTDTDGRRYEIAAVGRLDARSRNLISHLDEPPGASGDAARRATPPS